MTVWWPFAWPDQVCHKCLKPVSQADAVGVWVDGTPVGWAHAEGCAP